MATKNKSTGMAKFECGSGNTMEITFPEVTEAEAHMNIGVALMPFMKDGYYFLKEGTTAQASAPSAEGINTIETNFVEYLYKIRKANREHTIVKRNLFTKLISDPKGVKLIHRIFIAGKIYPILSMRYHGDDIDCATSKIKIEFLPSDKINTMYSGVYKGEGLSSQYISIDDKIDIFVPKNSEMEIDYLNLLIDFLTNGPKTQTVTNHGEFPDMDIYTLATDQTTLQPGCWLTEDREDEKDTWVTACMYILEHQLLGIFAPFGQIADFYILLDKKITTETTHKIRWLKGAKKLVNSLKMLDSNFANTFIGDDVEIILHELNIGICDYAITQFYELFYGKYKDDPRDTEKKAYEFDLQFVKYEQGTVAKPIYKKASKNAIEKYQDMADQDVKGSHGTGGWFMDTIGLKVVPEFDEPWDGKVTDAQFRIDLPMLMLWLDRHQPEGDNFKDKVNKDGYLLKKYKKIIEDYEAK